MHPIARFLASLEQSRLLTAAQLTDLRSEFEAEPLDRKSADLAHLLVERKLLTTWQASQLLAGETQLILGKYRLLNELGRGGMGAVYKAEQLPLGRIVAVKVMAEKLVDNEQAVARFRREIQAAAALNHPHVVVALDADEVAGTHLLVMEYVAGEGLDAILKRQQRLPIATACDYIRQAALGLQHAHERGMAHRDIKPGNLLVTKGPADETLVKVLDMGLARIMTLAQDDGELTSTGQIMGTPDYMAPEQARSTRAADIRSDIFSLGCTLFRALTGHLPYAGESVVAKLLVRSTEDAPSLRSGLPEAPAELELIVAKMLARDPAARFQTPLELALALDPFSNSRNPASSSGNAGAPAPRPADEGFSQALQQLAVAAELSDSNDTDEGTAGTQFAGIGTMARRPAASGGKLSSRLAKQSRSNRRQQVRFAATVVGCLALFGGWWGWERAGRIQLVIDWPADERRDARLEVNGVVQSLPERGPIPPIGGSAGSWRLRLERRGFEPIDLSIELSRGESKSVHPEWRANAAALGQQRLADLQQQIERFVKNAAGVLPASDDIQLSALRQIVDELRPQMMHSADLPRFESLVRRLPVPLDYLNSANLADTLVAVDRTNAPLPEIELVAAFGDSRLKYPVGVSIVAFSPDGKLGAAATVHQQVCIWDLATGRMRIAPPGPRVLAAPLVFSPDGRSLAWVSDRLVVWSIDEDRQVAAFADSSSEITQLAWIPNSTWLASSGLHEPVIQLWDLPTGEAKVTLRFNAGTGSVRSLATSPDGIWLAAEGDSGTIRVWNLKNQEPFDLASASKVRGQLAFSPDSRQLARAAEQEPVVIWNLANREIEQELVNAGAGFYSLAWNTDGHIRICYLNPFGGLVHDVSTGDKQVFVDGRNQMHIRSALSADGTRLLTGGCFGDVQIWDSVSGAELLTTAPPILAAGVNPQGGWVALGTSPGSVEIRELATAELMRALHSDTAAKNLLISPDGRLVAAVPHDAKRAAQAFTEVYEIGAAPRVLYDLSDPMSAGFSPDGKLLIVAGLTHLAAWNTTDLSLAFKVLLPEIRRFYLSELAVTPDSRTLVIKAWDDRFGGLAGFSLPTGKLIYSEPIGPVTALTATANPRFVVAARGSNLEKYEAATGKLHSGGDPLSEIDVYQTALAMSPDGENLISSSSAGELTILDADFLRANRTITLGNRRLYGQKVMYTPDGRHVVTLNTNGTVYVLRLERWGAHAERR